MSTEAIPKGKGGRAPANANNDTDSIMPLLFATLGNPRVNFKAMAAMDELGRSESALEHKFRTWRQKGRDITAKNPQTAGISLVPSGGANTKKGRAPAKKVADGKGKGFIEQAGQRDEDNETDEEVEEVKQEPNEMDGLGSGMPHPSIEGKAIATNSTKKRAASAKAAATGHEVEDVPAKKAKVVKKGTAKVVKKHHARVNSGSEDEDFVSEDEVLPAKPKGKAKGNVTAAKGKGKAAAKPTQLAKAKNGGPAEAEAGQIPIFEDEDAYEGKIEMQFDGAV